MAYAGKERAADDDRQVGGDSAHGAASLALQAGKWYSEDHILGTLYAHKSKTLQFKIAFHKGDPTGTYFGTAMIGARQTCGVELLAVACNLGPAYRP
ncbi:hypothetical protein [Actinoallomurus sp. NPDC050550]|uniref:hypothetical protein n=1 Tax=Actinoallomurus sp. NPDC050550 TaxID=3154937 RepID=UPI0034024B6B